MAAGAEARIGADELERALQAVEPATFLVSPRVLRRVIRSDRRLTGLGARIPHPQSYVIGREALLAVVSRPDLGVSADGELPSTVILLACPDPEVLAELPREEVLLRCWRLLFHARIHRALECRPDDHPLTEAMIHQRVHAIGPVEFDEVRAVLRQEHCLLPPRDGRAVYIEFAAVYLELRYFAPSLVPRYFPALRSCDAVDAVLAGDVDAARLFAETRLPGAPDPVRFARRAAEPSERAGRPPSAGPPSEAEYGKLTGQADRAAALGNVVRAAILRTRAAAVAPPEYAGPTRDRAQAEVDHLARRLQAALELDDDTAGRWRQALAALRERSARGVWPVEARLLYDLQKVCVEHEREVYAIDLADWALSLGRRPLKRQLANQPLVLALKHLRSAARRLSRARIARSDRAVLGALLASAIHRREHRLRQKLRPLLAAALEQVGLVPRNFPEQIARNKLIEELLDQVCERGYLTMGHLRDALSRNNLKLSDLAGPDEFLRGDALLRADHRLAVSLDGIYHRGEVYLRWLQRLSALAFGTPAGRFLTRYLALPFGGAFVILTGLYYLIEEASKALDYVSSDIGPVHVESLRSPVTIALLGGFLFGLMHAASFRRAVVRGLSLAGRGARALLDLPARFLRLPLVRRVLESRLLSLLYHCLFKPLAFAVPVWLVLRSRGIPPPAAAASGAAAFLAAGLFLNARWAHDLEEAFTDGLALAWYRFRTDVLAGLFRLVMAFFKGLLEAVDRFLYTVDEWLRFHTGDSRLSLVLKAVLGLFWSLLTYVVRFVVNLLIEPQVNPIKHFPVVTVSHKLLLPFIPALAKPMETTLGLNWELALTYSTLIIGSIPGIFGFLVWELKENWRLYAANRPVELGPVAIGHHGETMVRLLRPGFHSGTLPKLYARLRRKASRKHDEVLHQVEESIRHLVERKLLAVLDRSKGWSGVRIEAGEIALASNRVRVGLVCPEWSESSLEIAFDEQSGWLIAGVAGPGWLDRLAPEQRQTLRAAVAGFYKFAGIDLVREQIEACLAPASATYDITVEGLVVWTGAADESKVVYDLRAGDLPMRLLFRDVPLTWQAWIDVWERDQAGKGVPESFLEGVHLLPRGG